MPVCDIRHIEPLVPTDHGLDFGEFFDDSRLVRLVLSMLYANLDKSAVVYCFRFSEGANQFVPYDASGLITDSSIPLPTVERDRLLTAEKEWPVLAQWHARDGKPNHPPQFEHACWHGQLLLESNGKPVGYFKVVIPRDGVAPNDAQFACAFDHVKLWLQQQINLNSTDSWWFSPALHYELDFADEAIRQLVKDGRFRPALQILCTLATSHIAFGFNRVICLAPFKNTLRCVYAHGGDCSDEFASRVQHPVSQMAHSVPELMWMANASTPPHDDPLYRDLAASPHSFAIDVGSNESSVISRLWRQGGLFQGFSTDQLVIANQRVQFGRDNCFIVEVAPTIMAAHLSMDDPALRELRNTRPSSPLFGNRNGNFYTFIWTADGAPIAAVILDLGYYAHFDLARDVAPRLAIARALFGRFGKHFVKAVW